MPRMRRPLLVAGTALAVCTALVLPLATTEPAAAAGTEVRAARHTADAPSLTGDVKLARQPGDNVRFRIDAHGFADQARGTFHVSHHFGKTWGGYFKGRVDCLLTGGPVAVATGIVTESHFTGAPGLPEIGDLRGKRFGFTVLDSGKKDRLGYSWAMDGVPKNSVGKCLGSAPFETLEKGDLKVHHWMPPRGAVKQ